MVNLIPLLLVLIVLISTVLLAVWGINLSKRIKKKREQDSSKASKYAENVSAGIVSGVIIVILDKVIYSLFTLKFDTSSISKLMLSTIGNLVIVLFGAAFIFASVMYLLDKGLD